jgi:hypothetical protein
MVRPVLPRVHHCAVGIAEDGGVPVIGKRNRSAAARQYRLLGPSSVGRAGEHSSSAACRLSYTTIYKSSIPVTGKRDGRALEPVDEHATVVCTDKFRLLGPLSVGAGEYKRGTSSKS